MRKLATFAAFFCAAVAHAVSPSLTTVTPAGGQRGSEVDVVLRGDRLADAKEILLYGTGISVMKINDATNSTVKATLKIAADCPIGEHSLRVRTAGGISPLRIFYVGPFPSVLEKEPNSQITNAQPVSLNTTVEGSIGTEDVDYFAIEAKKNQRLSVEVEGARLGRTMFDPYVAIHDGAGKVIVSSDDTALLTHDAFVSILAPADGKYFVQVRDSSYSGSGHVYRMHVGTFPRPSAVMPLGGKADETIDVTFIGDPAGEFTQKVKLPAQAAGKYGVAPEHDGTSPSPNWIRVTDLANAAPVKAGTDITNAPLVSVEAPLALNGVLAKKGEPAFYRFKAKKDQNLEFAVYARRLGSPIDSVLTVFNAKGGSLGSNDDAAGNADSQVRVKIPADGEYIVKVADQLNRGGANFTFRVEIAEVKPEVTLYIPDTARYDNETRKSIVVPRGNRFAVLMNASKQDFSGDLKLSFAGLPKGIKVNADNMASGVTSLPVVFEAEPDAPIAGNLLTPAAAPVDAAKKVASRFRHENEWVRIQNATVYVRSEVNQIAAAVTEELPFKVRIVEPKVPIVQSGEMNLQIVAERQNDFNEPITVKMLWNPPGISSLPDMVIPKGSNSVIYKLNSTASAETRKWKIAVIAGAPVKGTTAYVSSQLAELEVAPSMISGKTEITKVERGQKAKMVCVLDQKIPFEGKAHVRIVGLPDNVSATEVDITKDSKEAVFEITTTDKSPAGYYKNLFCNVAITQKSETISQNIAPSTILRIDAPRTKQLATAKGSEKPEAAPVAATPSKPSPKKKK